MCIKKNGEEKEKNASAKCVRDETTYYLYRMSILNEINIRNYAKRCESVKKNKQNALKEYDFFTITYIVSEIILRTFKFSYTH